MQVSIDYECPACNTTAALELSTLAPGRKHLCRNCGSETELTVDGLARLRRCLAEHFGP